MSTENILTLSLVLVGGFLPALIWLYFVLKEDREHPEPRRRLIISFAVGMLAVLGVLPIQLFLDSSLGPIIPAAVLTFSFAFVEELMKFLFAYKFAAHTKDADEPIDEVVYMGVTALGFAALENCFFLATPLFHNEYMRSFLIANARFVGSTLVHTISSSIIGVFLAYSFYKKSKKDAIFFGLIFATLLHGAYNLLIMKSSDNILQTFLSLWIAGIALIIAVNNIKHLQKEN